MQRRHGILATTTIAMVATAVGRQRIRRTEVNGRSMEPALAPGDYVLTVAGAGVPRRGDVIVIAHPGAPGFDLIKRVVALPYEHVTVSGGRVHIDGQPLDEPWSRSPTAPDGAWTVGRDEVFVLGDNRGHSLADGRTLGPVSLRSGWWHVRFRYWPVRRIARL